MIIYKGKVTFLYSADCSKHFTLHPPPQTCSFQRHLDFSGKYSAMPQLPLEDLCLQPGTHLCSWVNCGNAGWTNLSTRGGRTCQRGVDELVNAGWTNLSTQGGRTCQRRVDELANAGWTNLPTRGGRTCQRFETAARRFELGSLG